MINYYFAAASTKFLVEKEPTEEILRERTYYYLNHDKAIDFWIVNNPKFFYKKEFQTLTANLPQPITAIVSTDKKFIDWIKLRIVYVITGTLSISNNDEKELLTSEY